MDASATPATTPPGRYEALDALRGVAVLMVVYDHLFAVAGERMAGAAFAPVPWVRHWVSGPLGIIQDFGWLGVCLFFLISGFVIAHAARREPLHVFAVRRVLRIFPPLAAAVVVAAVLHHLVGTEQPWQNYLVGVTLAGYLAVPQIIVLDVAWTLVIEVIFYVLIGVLSPLLKSRLPALALVAGTALPLLVIVFARDFGGSFFLFAASTAYVPLLLIGSALYLRRTGCIGLAATAVLMAANYAVFVLGLRSIHTVFLPIENSYLVSAAYALGLFMLALDRPAPRALKFVGDISYSLYLLHGTLGFFVVYRLLPYGAGMAAPIVASVVCIVASYAFYRGVERPAMALGKRLASSRRRAEDFVLKP